MFLTFCRCPCEPSMKNRHRRNPFCSLSLLPFNVAVYSRDSITLPRCVDKNGSKIDTKNDPKTGPRQDHPKTSPGFRATTARGRRAVDGRSTPARPGDFWNQGPPGEVRRGRAPPGKEKRIIYTLSQHASGQRPCEFCRFL